MLVKEIVNIIRDDRFFRFVFPSHNGLQRHRMFLIESIMFETLCVNIFLKKSVSYSCTVNEKKKSWWIIVDK